MFWEQTNEQQLTVFSPASPDWWLSFTLCFCTIILASTDGSVHSHNSLLFPVCLLSVNTIKQNPDEAWRNYILSSKLGWSEQKPSLSHLPTSSTASGCSFPSSCSRTASSSACRIHRSSCSLTQTELDCDLNWYTRQSTAVARETNTLTFLLPPLLLGWKPPAESWGQRAEEDDFLGYTKLDHHSAFGSSFCRSLSCPGTRL